MPSGAPGAFVSAPLTLGDAALFTDLYELTMAAAFFREGVGGSATFSLYVRRLPPERGFLVAAGLADVLEYLRGFRFSPERAGLPPLPGPVRAGVPGAPRDACASPGRCGRCAKGPCSSPRSRSWRSPGR